MKMLYWNKDERDTLMGFPQSGEAKLECATGASADLVPLILMVGI